MAKILDGLSYLRSYVVTLFFGFWTLFMAAVVIFLAAVLRIPRTKLDGAIIDCWARPMLWLNGIRVHARGQENIKGRAKGFLILFNHSSHLDIPVMFSNIPRTFNFGAKIELFKVPFFGRAMALCGVLPIDRSNRSKVMEIYNQAIERVNQGESFALAPEGTRQAEPKLGFFKRGPFEFAINAQMDIVPVVMAGVYYAMPRSSIWINAGRWRRHIFMEILPPIAAGEFTLENSQQLQDLVRGRMLESFNRQMDELSAFSPRSLS